MLRRLIFIGTFTGLAQIFSLFVVKYLSANYSVQEITQLAKIDSYFQLSITLIALGLQSAAIRDISLQTNWQEYFKKVQSARLTLSLFLFPIGFAGYYNPVYYIFFLSPILASSGDYALYATGKPVMGSIVASIRTILPYILVLMSSTIIYMDISYWYLAGTLFAYIITNWFIARHFSMSLFFVPSLASLHLYLKTIPLGLVNLCLYIIGLGLLIVIPGLYPDNVIASAFVGLKFYVIIKGVLRLIHQAYIREMQDREICLRTDQLSLLLTITIAAAFLIFPVSTITLLFGANFLAYKPFFLVLVIAGIVYSFNLSMATKALLDRKDRKYTVITVAAAVSTIFSTFFLSLFYPTVLSIGLSILLGELVFTVGLLILMGGKNLLWPRLQFLLYLMLALTPIYILRLFVDDSLLLSVFSLAVFVIVVLFINRHRFVASIHPAN